MKKQIISIVLAALLLADWARGRDLDGVAARAEELGQETEDVAVEVVGNLSFREAMKLLKPAEQEVLDLKVLGGFTFQEIAALLKKPMGTVTWLYRQGIRKLRRYHKPEQEVQE